MNLIWQGLFWLVLIWSGWQPFDRATWLLEVFPALAAWAVLLATRQRFPLTPLLYVLILLHCIILMIGGKYTYALVPAGDWVSELFGWSRNNYDKLGHLAQGFVPAMVARELFIRLDVVASKGWRFALITLSVLGISAAYELIEWWVALLSEEAAESFLGTQGYVWDTQSDMFMALIGAITALLLLGKFHDRQLARR
jgi:putative membrane protein